MDDNSLKDLQLKEVELLLQVTAVAEQMHIKYYLSTGTLLEAIRHKGFIPYPVYFYMDKRCAA